MTKSELIHLMAAENPHLFLSDVKRVVNAVFDEISNALANGDRVELRGFCSFSVKLQLARTARNPRTGASVEVPEKFALRFKTGNLLHDRLNGRA